MVNDGVSKNVFGNAVGSDIDTPGSGAIRIVIIILAQLVKENGTLVFKQEPAHQQI